MFSSLSLISCLNLFVAKYCPIFLKGFLFVIVALQWIAAESYFNESGFITLVIDESLSFISTSSPSNNFSFTLYLLLLYSKLFSPIGMPNNFAHLLLSLRHL